MKFNHFEAMLRLFMGCQAGSMWQSDSSLIADAFATNTCCKIHQRTQRC